MGSFHFFGFRFGFRYRRFHGSSGFPGCFRPFGHRRQAAGCHFSSLVLFGRLGFCCLGSFSSLFPGLFLSFGSGFCPGFGPGLRSGLSFCPGLGIQFRLFFRFGFGGFLCFGFGLGLRLGFGFILGFFFGRQTGPDPFQPLAGVFSGCRCLCRFGLRTCRCRRFRRGRTAVVDGRLRHIPFRIHTGCRKVDFDFPFTFIQHRPGMVYPDQAPVPVHIIGIRNGLEFGRIHIIQILEPVLGQHSQLIFGVVIAERPQFPGFPVKGHAHAFFHTHIGSHHQGKADQILVRFVHIVMDLAPSQGGGFTDKGSHLAAEGAVDFVICRAAAAADLRTFHCYFIFCPGNRLHGYLRIRRPYRNRGGPQDQTAHQDSTSFFQH